MFFTIQRRRVGYTAVLFGSDGNSYTVCTQSDACVCVCVCVYTHFLHNTETTVGVKVTYKLGHQ